MRTNKLLSRGLSLFFAAVMLIGAGFPQSLPAQGSGQESTIQPTGEAPSSSLASSSPVQNPENDSPIVTAEDSAGSSTVPVQSQNQSESGIPSDKTHDIYTVSFVYPEIKIPAGNSEGYTLHELSGKVIDSIQVAAGETAVPPVAEVPEGFAFIQWDSNGYENVQQDTVVTAELLYVGVPEQTPVATAEPETDLKMALSSINNQQVEFTDYANWDMNTDYGFVLTIYITPNKDNGPNNQKVLITAPAGMRLILAGGTTDGITDRTLSPDASKCTITLDPVYIGGSSGGKITTSLFLGGYTDLAATNKTNNINSYRAQYLLQKKRPEFKVSAEYTQDADVLGSDDITLIPKAYTSLAANAFNSYGVYGNSATTNPSKSSRKESRQIFVGRSGSLYRGNGTTAFPLSSYYQLVWRQAEDTASVQYEPVWDVSVKMYIPDMFTLSPENEGYIKTDAGGRYVLFGGPDGLPGATEANNYGNNTLDSGTVFYISRDIGLRLKDGVDPASYYGTQINTNMEIKYSTVNAQGTVEPFSQNISSAMEWIFTSAAKTDWLKIAQAAKYPSGFIISKEIVDDPDVRINFTTFDGLNTATFNTEIYDNETHKGGTIYFENNGGYSLDFVSYPAGVAGNTLGQLSAKYYMSDNPGTGIDVVPVLSSGIYKVTLPAQSINSYVTKVEFHLADGYSEKLSSNGYFRFGMHGFDELTPNKPGDNNYYHSSITAVAKGSTSCGGAGINTTYSSPAPTGGEHRTSIPVMVSLVKQDVLTMVVSGKYRNLHSDINYSGSGEQIYFHFGYDSRNASGQYVEDPSAKVAYKNFRMDIGTPDPNQPDDSTNSSRLMLQRIKGNITLDASVHYKNARFEYTTKGHGESLYTLDMGSNGNPDDMGATGGTRNTKALTLDPGDYLTSLVFYADSIRFISQHGAVTPPSLVATENDDVRAGISGLTSITYWTPNYYGSSIKHMIFSTGNTRDFPDGTAIQGYDAAVPNRPFYNLFAEMKADNMNDGTTPRRSYVYPRGTVSNASYSANDRDLGITFIKNIKKDVYSVNVNSLSTTGVLQGNTFQVNLNQTAYNGYVLDGKTWIKLAPGFIYSSNSSNLKISQKTIGNDNYICIQDPEKFIWSSTGSRTWSITLRAVTTTSGYVVPIEKIWYDYTKTAAERDSLLSAWPYVGISDTSINKKDPNPPVFDPSQQNPVYLYSVPTQTISVTPSNSTKVTLVPTASVNQGTTGSVFVRPSSLDDLALMVNIGSQDQGLKDYKVSINIPKDNNFVVGGTAVDFPMFINGNPNIITKGFNNNDIDIKYIISGTYYLPSQLQPEDMANVERVEIYLSELSTDTVVISLPLKTNITREQWVKGQKSYIEADFSYEISGSPTTGSVSKVLWELEDIDKNTISGTVFYDYNYDDVYNTGDVAASGLTANLYEKNNLETPIIQNAALTSGQYKFSDLPDGEYVVKVNLTKPYTQTEGGYKFAPKQDIEKGNMFNSEGFSDVIKVSDFQTVNNLYTGIQYAGVAEINLKQDDAARTPVETVYLPLYYKLNTDALVNGVPVSPLTFPAKHIISPSQAVLNINYLPNSWNTTKYTSEILLCPQYDVTFKYLDQDQNEVPIVETSRMENLMLARGENRSITISTAELVTPAAYAYQGYKIGTDPTLQTGGTININNIQQDTNVVFVYKKQLSTNVKFNANGGMFTDGSSIKTILNKYEGQSLTRTEADGAGTLKTRTGYSFEGWSLQNTNDLDEIIAFPISITNAMAQNDILLYAVWKPEQVSINYFGNNQSGTGTTIYVTYGSSVTIEENRYEKTGYLFRGWATTQDGLPEYISGQVIDSWDIDHDIDLYAVWVAGSYDVIYDGNGSTSGSMENGTATYDQPFTLEESSYQKSGSNFLGWSEYPGGPVKYNDSHQFSPWQFNSELELFAVWQPIKYTVEYYSGAAGEKKEAIHTNNGSGLPLEENKFVKAGYLFKGWATTPGGSVQYQDCETISGADPGTTLKLYAVWSPKTYTITYYGNGETDGSMDSQNVVFDLKSTLSANTFEKTGHSFAGWATSEQGEAVYQNSQVFDPWATDGDMDLYAVWRVNAYKLSFDVTGGSPAIRAQNVNYAEKAAKPADPSRNGYRFIGWNTAADGSGTHWDFTKNTMPAEDLVLYALWAGQKTSSSESITSKSTPVSQSSIIVSSSASVSSRTPAASSSENKSSPVSVNSNGTISSSAESKVPSPSSSSKAVSSTRSSTASSKTEDSSLAVSSGSKNAPNPSPSDNLEGTAAENSADTTSPAVERAETLKLIQQEGVFIIGGGEGGIPLHGGSSGSVWSIMNLITAAAGVVISAITLVVYLSNRRKGTPKNRKQTLLSIAAILLGISTGILFAATQNTSQLMVLFDRQSLAMALIFAAQIILIAISRIAAKVKNN